MMIRQDGEEEETVSRREGNIEREVSRRKFM